MSQLTQASLVSLLSIQWLKNLTVLKASLLSPDPHPHTIHYNFGTILVPAPVVVAQKYQHLQEQTPSLSEHHHIPQDSWGGERREDGVKKRGEESRWKDEHSCCRERRSTEKIQTLYEEEDTVYGFILEDQPQTVSLFLDMKAPAWAAALLGKCGLWCHNIYKDH